MSGTNEMYLTIAEIKQILVGWSDEFTKSNEIFDLEEVQAVAIHEAQQKKRSMK